ncbi:cysteine desulfurase [Pseudobacter ginsenosidimutans]|jgi:cysteine desulfurase/selenocysteine lyase|uniref:Cysteine desulfurase n=1 Tax=Pseudobacter ginsenosidimutans TaxID=661488 RepID=A0A4Q7MWC3_9BACT|nr:cysteine desulfurase [Pseudobacter ginsenosidimutans]RZS71443.1 cysteine desulfurase/selenocysteine lyase [Pseudobacter ginsenosidimutans]
MNATSSILLDVEKIRKDFPILSLTVNGKPLVYLDNAATSQKPNSVIKAIEHYYTHQNSNIHRGVHFLSQRATEAYEVSRKKVAKFINAAHDHECLFTKGTTDGINLVAFSYGKQFVKPGDTIIISAMEHHSNIVPWQILCEDRGANLKVIPINEKGELLIEEYKKLLNEDNNVKLVSVCWISNSLGTVNPVKEIIALAHEKGIPVLLDAAQAVQHVAVDVQDLDVDFLAFSGHKLYGPTGSGILYGKEKWLNQMPPYQGGGDMIKHVTFAKTTYNELPFKFEAGTPNIEAGICISAGLDYLNELGIEAVAQYEHELLEYVTAKLQEIPGLRVIGTADQKASVVSFIVEGTHPSDIGVLLDKMGIAVRTGHHCTQPLMEFFGIPGTVRASLAFCNTKQEMDQLVDGVKRAVAMLV